MRTLWLTGVLCAVAACAPTTVSPLVIRMEPHLPSDGQVSLGVRTGPRLSAPLVPGGGLGGFGGDGTPFGLHQWGVAYDLSMVRRVGERLALHAGAQAEFAYPFPLPGVSLYGGLSHWLDAGPMQLAPSLSARVSTDFGISATGGPGSSVGLESSCSLSFGGHPRARLALVPFAAWHWTAAGSRATGIASASAHSVYAGGVVALRTDLGGLTPPLELTGGFGRVFVLGGPSWSVPLMGVRTAW